MARIRICYVIMPFGKDHDPVYTEGIRPAVAKAAKLRGETWDCVRADDIRVPGSITKEIITSLHTSDLIVADLSGNNPNVLYELGVAHSAGRITVMITQDLEALPFDINAYRVQTYSPSRPGLQSLSESLCTTIMDALSGRLQITSPVQDHAPFDYSKIILNLEDVRRFEQSVREEVWLIEPSLETDLGLFGDVIKSNIFDRGVKYRYLIPRTRNSLRQYRRFVQELNCTADQQDALRVQTIEPYLVESEVVIYDPYSRQENVMLMSPRELAFVFWYSVGKTRGEDIRDRFEHLWESMSEPISDESA